MIRYAISDRRLFAGDDRARQERVVRQASVLAREGVEYFQLREKDLDRVALFELLCAVRDSVQATGAAMRVVFNGPRDLGEQAGVGWHRSAGGTQNGARDCLSCSVHTLHEIESDRTQSQLLLFAPVFGKVVGDQPVQPGKGLAHLRNAVSHAQGTPVLALGGVTLQNAQACVDAGAAGVAGIRLFLR